MSKAFAKASDGLSGLPVKGKLWTRQRGSMAILPGDPPVEVHLRRSARARRFSLRVSRLDGKVTLSLPARAREAEALAFLAQQEGWVRKTLARMPEAAGLPVAPGMQLPVEGRLLRLMPGTGRAVRAEGETLLVPGDPAQAGARVAGLAEGAGARPAGAGQHALRGAGRPRLRPADPARHAVALGSCSHDRTLMYFLAADPGAAPRCWITSPRTRWRIWSR